MPGRTPVLVPLTGSANVLNRTAERPETAVKQCDADIAQLVERNLAKVEVASSSLVVRSERSLPVPSCSWEGLRGGLAERRGNGLQIRVHGFKSRTHLHAPQVKSTTSGDWRSGSALP